MGELNLLPVLIPGDIAIDDRGSVSFVNGFTFDDVKRFYIVENRENHFIRAWHGHQKEAKYVYILQGTALVAAKSIYDDSPPSKFVMSSIKPGVLYIPPGFYNGFMNLEPNTKIMFLSTSTLKESATDDMRCHWDTWNIWNTKDYR